MESSQLADPARVLFLYSTTPPRADSSEERVAAAVERFAARMRPLPLDGVVVYDVQDEHERTRDERPFPFLPTLPSRSYAARLAAALPAATVVTYKCIAGMRAGEWQAWLDSAAGEGLRLVSVVGRAASRSGGEAGLLSMAQALAAAAAHPAGFTLGGVAIPERHRAESSESARLLQKSAAGCRYFVSQAIYTAEPAIQLLRDYAADCERRQTLPARLFLTFTPCGSEKTLAFMRWLGVQVPDAAARRILDAPSPVDESVAICRENFERIMDAARELPVPVGINVESVSIRKEEIDGSITLHRMLAAAAS